jgi:hypothetical protein
LTQTALSNSIVQRSFNYNLLVSWFSRLSRCLCLRIRFQR